MPSGYAGVPQRAIADPSLILILSDSAGNSRVCPGGERGVIGQGRSTGCDPVVKPALRREILSRDHDRCDRDGTHDGGRPGGSGP